AEHSFLLVIVSAHSLASLAYLLSDEFFEIKSQRKSVFQQTASQPTVFDTQQTAILQHSTT
ncbi:MAG: hypothetical protein WAM96_05795, partial [Candidatus Acidiferrales bacterium]